ncbi:MAG TPA: protein-L-isoaspartate(D-aspartate) O-methyltransferase [Solirubrobacterales bacterium]|jgi:protein-L-isoaspartate(D-aspartate) O-methyltransferase|nr:protein-L-isoaspartate(D-aspartate) O-methyltransferase [Solirubrobacterales bacterium]
MAKPGDFEQARAQMVERQLRRRGIEDERVLAAMADVPREHFVPEQVRQSAYNDSALPIGHGQTISQPWVVAAICAALSLQGDERLLEIGTGSGYSAAVLARLARSVVSIERVPELGETAQRKLEELGIENVEVIVADGSRGYPEGAPYDAIAVHAATPEAPHSLLAELATDGRLVVPIATGSADLLTVFVRENGDLHQETIGPCRFVPLIGAEGFSPPEQAR